MVILLHVIIALASIIYTSYGYIRPSKKTLHTAYILVGLTLVSGFYLVWSEPATMLRACVTGLVYIGVVSIGIVATHVKVTKLLAAEK